MGVFGNGHRGFQQWSRTQPTSEYINSECDTEQFSGCNRRSCGDRNSNKFLRRIRSIWSTSVHNNKSRRKLPIYTELPRTWHDQPDNNTESNPDRKRNRHNFNVYTIGTLVLSLLSPTVSLAQGVGGVSATANPIANSSGSVTNQAIQVLQGPYITNTYGGGVQCQGSTFNLTPYVQFADSRKDPWEDYYDEPQYNLTDAEGKMVPTYVNVKNYPWEEWYDDRTYISDGTDGNTSGDVIRWFPDGSDITIIQDIDSPNGVPDIVDTGGEMTPSWYKPSAN